MARQRLGQHFLGDIGWRKKILKTLPLAPGETWVEIGPGHGEMTQLLAGDGRRIVAIEADGNLASGIRAGIENEPGSWPGVEIVYSDVLNADIGKLGGERFHVYGNLPYYITSPILQRLFDVADLIDEIHIVIQHEVALRLAAVPGTSDYGYLSVLTQYYSRPDLAMEIPREAFTPPPEVESALVTLRFPGARAGLAIANEHAFFDFVKLCFAKKRKTLVNNLRSLAEPAVVREALAALQLRPDARAEQLNVAQLAALRQRLET